MTDTWELPAAGAADEEVQRRLSSSTASISPQTKWDIDCMVRVVGPVLLQNGLLDGDAAWLSIRHSRSERAGGLTVEFDRHPDEIEPEHLDRTATHFRFRAGRPEKSEEALAALRRASSRRSFLTDRRRMLDDGVITAEAALLCDAVLPAYLKAKGLAEDVLDASLAEATVIEGDGPLIDAAGDPMILDDMSLRLCRLGEDLRIHFIKLGEDIVYKGHPGHARIIVRHQVWPDMVMSSMIGRHVTEFIAHPALDVPGLTIEGALTKGDSTTLVLTRIRGMLGGSCPKGEAA